MWSASKLIYRGKLLDSLSTVGGIHKRITVSEETVTWTSLQRDTIANILLGKDPHLLVIVGPCSAHDAQAAVDYAKRLFVLQNRYLSKTYTVVCTYLERPRTRKDRKGIVHDSDLNGSYDVEKGIRYARQCLPLITTTRVVTATEFLDPFLTPHIADLICQGAIGARTTESQTYRQLVSGSHCPVGFKNSTDGNINLVIDAIIAVREQHIAYTISLTNSVSTLLTDSNPHGHLILRGGREPNYGLSDITKAVKLVHDEGTSHRLIVDCSHGNGGKVAKRQASVARQVIGSRKETPGYVAGIMVESFL